MPASKTSIGSTCAAWIAGWYAARHSNKLVRGTCRQERAGAEDIRTEAEIADRATLF
jgi:hypothetical protein